MDYVDCEGRTKEFWQEISRLKQENAHLRVFASEIAVDKCDIR